MANWTAQRIVVPVLVACLAAAFFTPAESTCKYYADEFVEWAIGKGLEQTFETSNQVSTVTALLVWRNCRE